jgi:hypothetical protein
MPCTGSLTSLSLSLMMRLGNPDMIAEYQRLLRPGVVGDAGVSLVQIVCVCVCVCSVGPRFFEGVCGDAMMFAPVQVEAQAQMTDPDPDPHVHEVSVGAESDESAKEWIWLHLVP